MPHIHTRTDAEVAREYVNVIRDASIDFLVADLKKCTDMLLESPSAVGFRAEVIGQLAQLIAERTEEVVPTAEEQAEYAKPFPHSEYV